ncbi:MAG: hypothetical protein BWY76_00067 [bacterium ADurb.Bin429]|nr:MAG: hypothetical protein BWY76_00067 [bacterium ADurb.Bin429]
MWWISLAMPSYCLTPQLSAQAPFQGALFSSLALEGQAGGRTKNQLPPVLRKCTKIGGNDGG